MAEYRRLDLHGADRETAIRELDLWLNRVFLQGRREGSVICGRGRGILLRAVEEELSRHPLVESYRREGPSFVVGIVPRSEKEL